MIAYLERRCPERWGSSPRSTFDDAVEPGECRPGDRGDEASPGPTIEELRVQALAVLAAAAAEHDELTLGGVIIGSPATQA
jgi:hypothetical protein